VRITDVQPIVLRQPVVDNTVADGSQDDLIVLVHTDEGLVGIGEVDSSPDVVRAAILCPSSHSNAVGLREVLVGQDPHDIDGLWRRMYRASIYYGRRGPALHAMSGIEMALWDLRGKAEDRPVCELLGTPCRDRVRAYASTLMPDTEEEVRAVVGDLVANRGFTAVKLGWGPLGQSADHDLKLVSAARDAGGANTDIMIDAGLGYGRDVQTAMRVAREMQDLGICWLEEPFEPDELQAYAELTAAVDLPIAAGEHETTRWGFLELIERGGLDIVQPDVTRCGGLREAIRIDELARSHGRACVLHAWKSGIAKAASLHVSAVLDEAPFLEYCVAGTAINNDLTVQRLPLEDGYVRVPTGPGLGVDLDPELISRYEVHYPTTLGR